MLASCPSWRCHSEPTVLFGRMSSRAGQRSAVSDSQMIELLQALFRVLGRPANPQETHYFIKLNSWHVVRYPLIGAVAPKIPAIFLFRDPVEVLVSNMQQPASWIRPGVVPSAFTGIA